MNSPSRFQSPVITTLCGLSLLLTTAGQAASNPASPAAAPSAQVKPPPSHPPASSKPGARAPTADRAMSPAERKAWFKAMDLGRKKHVAKDYAGAIAAFSRALELFPDDPRALNELGWAAFFAGDLERAQSSTQKALDRTADPELKGATLYNLGRIHEKRGEKAQAIAAYRESLRVRQNGTVRSRLATLDPAAAAELTPLKPYPLAGPLAALKDWCKLAQQEVGEAKIVCVTEPAPLKALDAGDVEATGDSAFEEVRLVGAFEPLFDDPDGGESLQRSGTMHYALALRTAKGWYVTPRLVGVYNPGAFGVFEEIRIDLELTDLVPGGAPDAVMRYTHVHVDHDLGVNETETNEGASLVVCAVGPSGAPSCMGPVQLELTSSRTLLMEDEEPGIKHGLFEREYKLKASFEADGTLEISSASLKGMKTLPADVRTLLGKHVVRFP